MRSTAPSYRRSRATPTWFAGLAALTLGLATPPVGAAGDGELSGNWRLSWWHLGASTGTMLVVLVAFGWARRRQPRGAAHEPTPEIGNSEVDTGDAADEDATADGEIGEGAIGNDALDDVEIGDDDRLQQLLERKVAEVVEAQVQNAERRLEQRTAGYLERLTRLTQELGEQHQQRSANLMQELSDRLRHEAQNLSDGLHRDLETNASPFLQLSQELAQLPDAERTPLTEALETSGRLGDWIEYLWPILETASEQDRDAIPRRLPDPAALEWRQAVQTLESFRRADAGIFRRLSHGVANGGSDTPFLENAGLLAVERSFSERLKRYLEPFDHLGRLGHVTLALQYLLEAYPIEQLSKSQRSRLRQELSQTYRDFGLEEDFHALVAGVAAGVGLHYRPVRYYKSRTDRREFAFVRQQVSPISLSDRVGFEATTDKALIVRLERPFFSQLSSGIYYAGHAYVARG